MMANDEEYYKVSIEKVDKKKMMSICAKEGYKIKRDERDFLKCRDGRSTKLALKKIFLNDKNHVMFDTGLFSVRFFDGEEYVGSYDILSMKFVSLLNKLNEKTNLEVE